MGRRIAMVCLLAGFLGLPAWAGDRYWTEVPGISDVWEFVECGDVVYAATGVGLFRSETLPASWNRVKEGYFMYVACDGDTVLALESAIPDVPWVSHDGGETWTQIQGLDGEDIRGFAVAGSLALAAVRNGVLVSHDGGDTFSVYPILWSSTNDWDIMDVWTDGTQCVAVGRYDSGIWYSPTCETDSFQVVVDGSFTWLSADGSTIVAGHRYGGSTTTDAYISHDSGNTWEVLPFSWLGVDTSWVPGWYHMPFAAAGWVLGSEDTDYWDGTDDVPVYDGPFLYHEMDYGHNLGAGGFPHDAPISAMTIVDGAQPLLFAGVYHGPLFWYRFPDGWPTEPVDLSPPSPGTIGCDPRMATTAAVPSSVTLTPSASGATQVDVLEENVIVDGTVYWDGSDYRWTYFMDNLDLQESDWMPLPDSLPWTPGHGVGMHVFHAWFADDAGNFTNPSVFSALNILPSSVSLPEDHGWWTVLWLEAGDSITVGVSGSSGDGDILHWEPMNYGTADDYAIASGVNDSLTFSARATGIHMLLIYNWPGFGYLNGTVTVSSSKGSAPGASLRDNGTGPSQPPDPPAGTPAGGADKLTPAERAADANGDGRLDQEDIMAVLSNIWNGVTAVTTDCSGDGSPTAQDLACTIPAILFR